jgi:MtN3 and saliva related transmembrane protein
MNEYTIIGFIAASLTTASFLPQAIKVIKTRNTKDISLLMYLMFNTGVLLWLAYGILIKDFPLIIANFIALAFTGTILIMKIRYK